MASNDPSACSLCRAPFSEPQLLRKCGHTFCKACVNRMLVRTRTSSCPECRTLFTADDVRPNYALLNMSTQPSQDPLAALIVQQAMSSAPPLERPPQNAETLFRGLLSYGVPFGLARLISEEDNSIGLRIFVLDNSGSTNAYDGKFLGPNMTWNPCSRWEEIQQMALQQARFNAAAGIACEFVLLNAHLGLGGPGVFQEGIDLVTVNAHCGDVQQQMQSLEMMLRSTRPQGATPLRERLLAVKDRIQQAHAGLIQQCRRIAIILATDGLPTASRPGRPITGDNAKVELVETLRDLSTQLPIFFVVRLCTHEDDVVEYYNRVDREEELPLEVIDDMESEATEIYRHGNGWLAFSPLIHLIREGGSFVKLLDLLDERRFTPLEAMLLASHMLQNDEDEQPPPINDTNAFAHRISTSLRTAPLVYDVRLRRMTPCVDMAQLRRAIRPPNRFCICLF